MRAGVLVLVVVVGCSRPPSGGVACTDPLAPGDLVITEIFAEPSGPGTEWFEIYNAAERPVELEGLTITHSRTDGSKPAVHVMAEITSRPRAVLHARQHRAAGRAAYVDYGYAGDLGAFYNTGGGKLALTCGDTEIDSADYGDVKLGHSRELTAGQPPDFTVNDDQANWCESDATEFIAGNFGTPGQDNDCTPLVVGQCNDNGTLRPIVPPMIGDLVITELMPSPSKVPDAVGEWFEAVAIHDVDLNGVGLDRAGDTLAPDVITSTDCVHAAAGDYLVFAKSADATMNGGLPAVAGTFKFAMVAGSTTSPGDVQLVIDDSVIDAVSYSHSTNGASLQLDPALVDPVANDNESNFCNAVSNYGLGDLGTPGAPNAPCAFLPPAGMCNDGGTNRAIVKPAAGQLVITELMPNPKVEPAEESFEITNTGGTPFDLNELGLDRAGDTRAPDVIHAADCKPLAPAGFALLARSNNPAANGMLPAVDATFGFTMPNTGGDVRVLDGTTVLDAVTWTTSKDGISSQLSPDHTTTSDNDSAASFCPGTTPYGDQANQGTPKSANLPCP